MAKSEKIRWKEGLTVEEETDEEEADETGGDDKDSDDDEEEEGDGKPILPVTPRMSLS